ncbi:ATP-binding cassette domain-containing protein [Nocardioides sp. LMS-CY]|uniref:NitT/TauT family transport system ATP-binding protein n=1 Tax=Nocardioides soli TaxID=1036020 RepID=A0A7W4Z2F7_9ACTN|nr:MULTISPECIES: ABC transporter ATP-binding protein [Nocardioides]MBB3042590.1 NitT/TauT family transport system ATP-binding protein [Nocardioides soli]QWF22714.1 ATP-binding cassette domain-containing protein [Nocardioides sp. LMS-CY]
MTMNIESVTLTYERAKGDPVTAIRDIDLEVRRGEFVSLIGPSGCGKSTLLHCMGGMLRPSSGRITVDGEPITGPKPSRAAFVFQDYSLFPWRSVVDNAATGLRFAGVRKAERRAVAMKQLELVGLDHVAESYPAELSGGMQQRVAVARALAMDPQIMLMDEPFGALDEQSRRRIGIEMSNVLTEAEKTVVMVTHSLDEAIFWADRVLVMGKGPGRIVREFVVDAPRPRRLDFMTTASFDTLRAELFGLLEGAPEEVVAP